MPYGQKYCEKHKPLHPEEVRSAGSRGYNRAWQKARKEDLEAHPLCVRCIDLVRFVFKTCKWDKRRTYRIAGKVYHPAGNMVYFDLDTAFLVLEGRLV